MSDKKLLLTISNDGAEIVNTNYFETPMAKIGKLYLSWNAGHARLLIPQAFERDIKEMSSAKLAIISHGFSKEYGREMLEILFEDSTDNPYCIFLSTPEQTDRVLPMSDHGSEFFLTVWTKTGKKLEIPARYRKVNDIPFLKPWNGA